MIGDSHVTHWASFARAFRTSDDDKLKLSNFRFVGVGGSTLESCIDDIQGKNLPKRKRYLKDQWASVTGSTFVPDFIIFIIGSNSVDRVDKTMRRMYKQGLDLAVIKKKMNVEFFKSLSELQHHQVKLFKFVTKVYSKAKVCYIPIAPRAWWGYQARCIAGFLDYHFIKKVAKKCKLLEVRAMYRHNKRTYKESEGYKDDIMDGYLDYDPIHFNDRGYRLLTTKVTVPLSISKYSQRYGPGSK